MLEEILLTLKSLDALVSYNLALVHISGDNLSASSGQSEEESPPDLSLTLHDLVGDAGADCESSLMALSDSSAADAPLARTAQKYVPLIQTFPELQSVPVTRLELLANLRESVISGVSGIERGSEIYEKACSIIRGCAVAFEEICIHNFIQYGEPSSGEAKGMVCGACDAGSLVFCAYCRQHFCISCAKGSDILLSVALARSLMHEDAEKDDEEEEVSLEECVNCGRQSLIPRAVHPEILLCGTCSSMRCCAHCISCPSKIQVPHGDPLQKLFCLKCATGAHNLSTLLQNLRECLTRARPCAAVSPHVVSLPHKDSHGQLLVGWEEMRPPQPADKAIVVASNVTSRGTHHAKSGAAFQSCLILPRITHIHIECKRLNNNAASKLWLSRLASTCLETQGKEAAIERCRRVSTLTDSGDKRSHPSVLSTFSTFEGPLALQGEYPRLVLDIMILFCIQGAWSADEMHIDNIMADATVHCLLRWKPRALPSYCTSYAWLSPACLREAKALCSTRAPWHSGCCPIPECTVQPSVIALLTAWKSAPPGSSSQLAAAFSCGHVWTIASSKADASRCLNPACARLPPQSRIRDFSIPHVDDNRPPLKMSRCCHCDMPLSFGRSVFGLRDVLRSTLKRERASLLPQLARTSASSAVAADQRHSDV